MAQPRGSRSRIAEEAEAQASSCGEATSPLEAQPAQPQNDFITHLCQMLVTNQIVNSPAAYDNHTIQAPACTTNFRANNYQTV